MWWRMYHIHCGTTEVWRPIRDNHFWHRQSHRPYHHLWHYRGRTSSKVSFLVATQRCVSFNHTLRVHMASVQITWFSWIVNHWKKQVTITYCKTQNIHPTWFSPTREELLFRPVLNSPSYNIDYTFYMRMIFHPCLEFAHIQLGKIKTRANKTRSTVYKIQCGFKQ